MCAPLSTSFGMCVPLSSVCVCHCFPLCVCVCYAINSMCVIMYRCLCVCVIHCQAYVDVCILACVYNCQVHESAIIYRCVCLCVFHCQVYVCAISNRCVCSMCVPLCTGVCVPCVCHYVPVCVFYCPAAPNDEKLLTLLFVQLVTWPGLACVQLLLAVVAVRGIPPWVTLSSAATHASGIYVICDNTQVSITCASFAK